MISTNAYTWAERPGILIAYRKRDCHPTHHVHRDLNGSLGGPLTVPALEHVQPPVFNGELDVLHLSRSRQGSTRTRGRQHEEDNTRKRTVPSLSAFRTTVVGAISSTPDRRTPLGHQHTEGCGVRLTGCSATNLQQLDRHGPHTTRPTMRYCGAFNNKSLPASSAALA